MLQTLLTMLLIVTLAIPAAAASPEPRPYTGSGVLVVRPSPAQATAGATVVLYQDPGVGRIDEFPLSRLSRLAPVMEAPAGEQLLAVMARKGKWFRIAYDDAGREGWLEPARSWEYQPWEQFLRGRMVRLLPGLRKGHYILRNEPAETATPLDLPGRAQELRVIDVKGDWALVMVGPAARGWLCWRDNDGRFLVSVDVSFTPQKH